ncbi:hypothetical protein PIB30_095511 [Stylosanthes scabra]|uniref:Uncharacterized protein n=1 Tax=Stylosanthes scabra TaxID=79078 RepID=A0ABU6TVB4_9FABA|nr:hypothetical protein [Stylosanthes scabra]
MAHKAPSPLAKGKAKIQQLPTRFSLRDSEEEDPEMDPEGEDPEVDSANELEEVPEYIAGVEPIEEEEEVPEYIPGNGIAGVANLFTKTIRNNPTSASDQVVIH